jgi:PLD-like domain
MILRVIEIQHGRDVWGKLRSVLERDVQREVAIAYIGLGAIELMHLREGDVVTFDGSDSSVAAGHVHLPEIKKMLKAGVTLFSRPALHAKMILLESAPPIALVGSANASRNSRDNLVEAVAVFDDPDAVQIVRKAMLVWRLGVEPIDKAWMDHASTIDRLPQAPKSKWKPANKKPLTNPDRTMWLWLRVADDFRPTKKLQAAIDNAVEEVEELGVSVEPYRVPRRKDMHLVEEGDSLLLLPVRENQDRPTANTVIPEPVRILKKLELGARGGMLFLGFREGGQTRRWRAVEAALDVVGRSAKRGKLSDTERDEMTKLFGV